MKKVHLKTAVFFTLSIFGIALLIFYFRPRPVVSGRDCRVMYVKHNVNNRMEHLENYDEQKILAYLKTCHEQRNLFQNWTSRYSIADVDLELMLLIDGKHKELLLGNFNYSRDEIMLYSIKWGIKNANEVRLTLRDILDLP